MNSSPFPLSMRFFGGFDVQVGGLPLPKLRSRKEQWLLALLILEHARPVPRTTLAQTLWPFPDHAADQAGYNLRRSLSELRRALGTEGARLLSPTPRSIRLAVEGAEIDVVGFDEAVKRGEREDLELAVTLYRGPFLPECTETWAVAERTKREQAYLQVLEDLAANAASRGELESAVRYLRQCIAVDPIREKPCRALMAALAEAGEVHAALQVYQELSRLLHRARNAAPTPETTALFQRVRADLRPRALQATTDTKLSAAPPLRPLPSPLSSLIGREEQTRGISSQLGVTRLVTLTGSGGVGKTRLAIQVAEELADCYQDGLCFVALGALTDPTLVAQTVASTLDLREPRDQPIVATLIANLQRRQMLLILDGCEHLVPACSDLVVTLLQSCRHLRILATSRQPLEVPGEVLWRVPSLSLPDPRRLPTDDAHLCTLLSDYAAIRLFVDRARLVQPGFQVTPQNARAITQICTRLDGIPLAIELAAARIKALTIEQLARRLNQIFRVLTGGPQMPISRQTTMEATIRWSYDLLAPDERLLLARLSVFAGGWTLEAAEEISGDFAPSVLDTLTRLVDRSLVLFDEQHGNGRYRMLETVRQYAHERLVELGEETTTSQHHALYCVRLAEEAEPKLFSSGAEPWLTQLEAEHDNLRAALEFALGAPHNLALATRIAAALWRFWYRRAYVTEGRSWLSAVLSGDSRAQDSPERAKAYNGAGFLAFHQGDAEAAHRFLAESRSISERLQDRRLIAAAMHNQGYMAWYLNDCASARAYYEQELEILRLLDDKMQMATTLCQLGIAAGDMGDAKAAQAHFSESLDIAQHLGDLALIATTLHSQAHLVFYQRDYPAARALYERVLTISHQINDQTRIATALHRLGAVAEATGDTVQAGRYYAESLVVGRKLDEKNFIAAALQGLGNTLMALGEFIKAKECLRESLILYMELKDRRGPFKTIEALAHLARMQNHPPRAATLLGTLDVIRTLLGSGPKSVDDATGSALAAAMGHAAYAAALNHGRSFSFEEVIAYALAE